jgi:hypothetical protein
MNGRPHNFIDNQEMMDFYKNQMNRVNGAINMLPNNDYLGAGSPNIGIGGPMGGGNLLGGRLPMNNHQRNLSYNQVQSH